MLALKPSCRLPLWTLFALLFFSWGLDLTPPAFAKEPKLYLVMLRQPWPATSHPLEMRTDPFWEYGSFGLTGCHTRNLLNPRNKDKIEGARLGFVQGGKEGMKLVFVTPPIRVICHSSICEVKWTASEMPFRYDSAPVVANYEGETDFPLLMKEFSKVKRETPVAKFASGFRSRTEELPSRVASEVTKIYQKLRREGGNSVLAREYFEALPKLPPKVDRNRSETYDLKLKEAKAMGKCDPDLINDLLDEAS